MSVTVRFTNVRCPVCKKLLSQIGDTAAGHVRCQCSRCKTNVVFLCKPGSEPKAVDVRNNVLSPGQPMQLVAA